MNTFQHESKSITSAHYRLFEYRKADKYIIKLTSGEYKIYRNRKDDWSMIYGPSNAIIYRSTPYELLTIIEEIHNNCTK